MKYTQKNEITALISEYLFLIKIIIYFYNYYTLIIIGFKIIQFLKF